ncbi:hypothetical protein EB796_016312 [Bugula neritina]|uniref:Uncharacterized protein n=1 Tax=Bugula neritina TaxID=10212 RepID=A0A7J7JGZ2_BUGNE|nr:hypothetical protein EB796_016312 [Bugula neritina]
MMMQNRNGSLNRSNGELRGYTEDPMPHREMAIDVPSNFVEQPKEKPRLTNSNSLSKDERIKKYRTEVKSKKEQELR